MAMSSKVLKIRATQLIAAAMICIAVASTSPAANNVSLMVQQTPVDGGVVTPGTGVHEMGINNPVTLSAIPKPGYQFVYWIGDVSDSTAPTTSAFMDSPKIIIAVFERVEHAYLAGMNRSTSTPHNRLLRSAGDYSNTVSNPVGGKRYGGGGGYDPYEPPESDPFPVPEDADDFPVPVPEPATGLLLMGGFAAILRNARQRRKKI